MAQVLRGDVVASKVGVRDRDHEPIVFAQDQYCIIESRTQTAYRRRILTLPLRPSRWLRLRQRQLNKVDRSGEITHRCSHQRMHIGSAYSSSLRLSIGLPDCRAAYRPQLMRSQDYLLTLTKFSSCTKP